MELDEKIIERRQLIRENEVDVQEKQALIFFFYINYRITLT